jgi:hypothetical protein
MEELLILQEEQTLQKSKKFYDCMITASNYIELLKKEKSERIENESQDYGKKPKPQLFS